MKGKTLEEHLREQFEGEPVSEVLTFLLLEAHIRAREVKRNTHAIFFLSVALVLITFITTVVK